MRMVSWAMCPANTNASFAPPNGEAAAAFPSNAIATKKSSRHAVSPRTFHLRSKAPLVFFSFRHFWFFFFPTMNWNGRSEFRANADEKFHGAMDRERTSPSNNYPVRHRHSAYGEKTGGGFRSTNRLQWAGYCPFFNINKALPYSS